MVLSLREGPTPTMNAPPGFETLAADNPLNAHALALLAAIAGDAPAHLTLPAASGLLVDMEVRA